MAAGIVPHLANDQGVEKIFVGVRELCMGARPPFDHPHIFIDMGADTQALCPYCSTLFIYDARLAPDETDPKVHRARPGGGRCRRGPGQWRSGRWRRALTTSSSPAAASAGSPPRWRSRVWARKPHPGTQPCVLRGGRRHPDRPQRHARARASRRRPHLRAVAVEPLEIRVVDGLSGAGLTALPLGGWIAERHGAPYCVAHRADVQNALLARVREEPLVSIETGFAVSTVAERAGRVEVTSSTGEDGAGRRSSPPTGCGRRSARRSARRPCRTRPVSPRAR